MAEKKSSILVVDDSPTMCRTIAATLLAQGYDVTTVGGGAQAIKAVKSGAFHLMTLDVEMPGLAGIDVLRVVQGMDPDLFIIMVSSLTSLQTAIQAIRLGAYDFISKPFDPEDLILGVKRALRQRSLVLENRRLVVDLRSLNDHLEELVNERTRELEDAHGELVRRHQELEDAYRKLRELDLLKEKFIAITSHELATPLTVILGFSELLAAGMIKQPEKTARAVNAIAKNVERLTAIVAEITDIARLREKRLTFAKEPVRLQDIVETVAEELRSFVEQRNQVLEVGIPADLPPVLGDPHRLGQVLSNLILNAIRFTPDEGRIAVTAREEEGEGDFIRLSVSDTGIGIEEEQLDHILEEFYEAGAVEHHHSGTFQFGSAGIGLGLAIVSEIIKEHGGRIWAESAKSRGGVGSTFHLLLPRST